MTGLERLKADLKLHDIDRWGAHDPLQHITNFILEELAGGAGHTEDNIYELLSDDLATKIRTVIRPALLRLFNDVADDLSANWTGDKLESILTQIQHGKFYSGRGWRHWTENPDTDVVDTMALFGLAPQGGVQ